MGYKEEIIKLVEKITNEKHLKYILTLLKAFLEE